MIICQKLYNFYSIIKPNGCSYENKFAGFFINTHKSIPNIWDILCEEYKPEKYVLLLKKICIMTLQE